MTTSYIGHPISRVDGPAKVTGRAKFAGEHHVSDLAYGAVVSSTIAKGRIARIDSSEAYRLEGMIHVFTHENAPSTAWRDRSYRDDLAAAGSPFRPLKSDRILFSGQPVALVVADTPELAHYAATLVDIGYAQEPHTTDLSDRRNQPHKPKIRKVSVPLLRVSLPPPPDPRGQPENALAEAAVKVEAEYHAPAEHHNPMEPFATTVIWEGNGKLTVYDKTQGPRNNHRYVCNALGLAADDVRLLCPYVGGGFGIGLRPQYQLFLAVMAARALKRSVRIVLTRPQMFTLGYRPPTRQHVALGAAKDGTLQAILHNAVAGTSRFEDYSEPVVDWSGELYRCENVKLDHRVVRLDLNTPCDMRAPGAAWGLFALESAMDELAYELRIDPLELRLKNYTETDPSTGKRFSSKALRECYSQGAERFGWSQRNPRPRSMQDGEMLVGWGMATGVWDSKQTPTGAKAVLTADGKLTVSSATADIGTGTYTIMTQIAAETLGLPIENVTFRLGDSSLPNAPAEGGSFTASTVGTAVQRVCDKLRWKLFKLARDTRDSALAKANLNQVMFSDGSMTLDSDPSRSVSITRAMREAQIGSIETDAFVMPHLLKQNRYTRRSHSAVFAEVRVDDD